MSLEIKGILPKRIINGELERLAERIRAKWVHWANPRLPEIITAASLAQHGFLRSVEEMRLSNVDLASVPAEHMASLAACVTKGVVIWNVHNCDLVNILENLKCRHCEIFYQSLNREESMALVGALETNVREFVCGAVILNITALTKYSGQGLCKSITCDIDDIDDEDLDNDMIVMNIYLKQLRIWAQRINWELDEWTSEIQFFRKEEKPGT